MTVSKSLAIVTFIGTWDFTTCTLEIFFSLLCWVFVCDGNIILNVPINVCGVCYVKYQYMSLINLIEYVVYSFTYSWYMVYLYFNFELQ
jgi:hypothetical protein